MKKRGWKKASKGQISIELVITIGFALLMIIPLTILLFEHGTTTMEEVNNNQAGLIARKITDAANSVYYLGYPSTVTLKVYMPDDIESINISGPEINFRSVNGDIFSTANVNLTGSLKVGSGIRYIKISALENLVNITEDVR